MSRPQYTCDIVGPTDDEGGPGPSPTASGAFAVPELADREERKPLLAKTSRETCPKKCATVARWALLPMRAAQPWAATTIREHTMTTTHTRTKALSAVVGAAIATIAAPALLFIGAGTAQAIPDISARGPAGTIGHLPTPRGCSGCDGFNLQPDTPDYPDLLPLTPDPGETVGTHIGKGTASGDRQ
jgi:hypothetical protein